MKTDDGHLELRLARDARDLAAAQRLRYAVFVEELGGDGPLVDHPARLERDAFDAVFDHLILVDRRRDPARLEDVVGVYRVLPSTRVGPAERFYSEDEYDLTPLRISGRRLLELGRSCVHPDHRGGSAMYHLWNGLADYVLERGIEVLFGVASFHGTDPTLLAQPLAWLHHHHLAPTGLRVAARPGHRQPMDLLPEPELDRKAAMLATPALIKAYLRLGGFVGDGAWIDHAFNTTDVCLVMDTARMSERHRAYYSRKHGAPRMNDWREARVPPWRPGVTDWVRIVIRGGVIFAVTYGGLVLLLVVRLIEAPLFAPRRPVTPWITQFVCRAALFAMGLALVRRGRPMAGEGAIVANHSSWLDIFVLNACDRIYFVSKAEVAGWAGIGWLARATGTVFIARKSSEARAQADLFESRLQARHRLLFFPEGTSTDAIRIMPFKSTLFAAFFAQGLRDRLLIQPVSVVYHAPHGADARFYGWWGEMAFAPHFLRMLATARHGQVEVTFHDPVAVADFPDRKALAAHCEAVVRTAHDIGLPTA